MGYKIKVLDLINMGEGSDSYNPFNYIKDDNDIQKLVTILFKATAGGEGNSTSEPYWDNMASALCTALVSYCFYFLPKEQQNWNTVNELVRLATVDSENDMAKNDLDKEMDIIRELPNNDPRKIVAKFYDDYHKAGGKALQSIQSVLSSRLNKFNIPSVNNLTSTDTIDMDMIGQERTVVYIITPVNDDSFDFIASMFYSQLFDRLYYIADNKFKHRLPVPVQLYMDEWANIKLPENFKRVLATCRSYGISINIIVQSLDQIKERYEKGWGGIVGNCDTLVYLGGNETETYEYLSKLLGSETIATNTSSASKGSHGSFTVNDQQAGRELLKPEEVRLLNHEGNHCLIFVRDEYPLLEEKASVLGHPNERLSYYGEGSYYIHNKLKYDNLVACSEEEKNMKLQVDFNVLSLKTDCYSSNSISKLYLEATDI